MYWSSKRRQQAEAVQDARRACLQRGAVIYTALSSDELGLSEYMILTPEEFQCVRMFAMDERPDIRLDCIWAYEDGTEKYYARLDWDIRQITDIS